MVSKSNTTAIHLTNQLDCFFHDFACSNRLGCFNPCLISAQNQFDFLSDNSSLNKRKNISQKPSHTASANLPFVNHTPPLLRFSRADLSTPSHAIEINNIPISVPYTGQSNRETPLPTAANCNRSFAIKAPCSPADISDRRPVKWPDSFMGQPLFLSHLAYCSISDCTTSFATRTALSRPVRLHV